MVANMNSRGYSEDRNWWSTDATERLFPEIAKRVLNAEQIEYAWRSKWDLNYGVDAIAIAPKRNYTLAIRIRGGSYLKKYGDITLRYDSLQTLDKSLEIYKSVARVLFYAWADTENDKETPANCFLDWHFIALQPLIDKVQSGLLTFKGPYKNKDKSSTHVAFNISDLRRHHLLIKSAKLSSLADIETSSMRQGSDIRPANSMPVLTPEILQQMLDNQKREIIEIIENSRKPKRRVVADSNDQSALPFDGE